MRGHAAQRWGAAGGPDGGTGDDIATGIQQTVDGGYIVAGSTSSFGAGGSDAWLLKLNADGSVAWQKTYGGASADGAAAVRQSTDGGYIVAGFTNSFGAGSKDAWVLKLNADGSVAWQKAYGGTGSDAAQAVQQTTGGGFIVAGYTSSFGAGGNDIWVLKLNADGSVPPLGANSTVTPQNSSVAPANSTAAVGDATVVGATSACTVTTTNCTVTQQAP